MHLMTVAEVAIDLGLSDRTIQRYCKADVLPAQQVWEGNHCVYKINSLEYSQWKQVHFKGLKRGQIAWDKRKTKDLNKPELLQHVNTWLNWCSTGKLNGKPVSPRTAVIYRTYIKKYLSLLGKRPCLPLISIDNLREAIGLLPVESFSTRRNVYDSVRSFAKYLIEQKFLELEFLERMKALRPKRFLPAKRTSLTEIELKKFINSIDLIQNYPPYDKLTSKTIVTFLASTGLRSSEMCDLKLEHVDFERQRIFVYLGKGNRNRYVGMSDRLCEALAEYLEARARFKSEYFFIGRSGNKFTHGVLAKKIQRLAKHASMEITAHGLRRTFITINANKGFPLNHLRIAAGHSDLSTTQSYLMTTQDEVVEAMKGW